MNSKETPQVPESREILLNDLVNIAINEYAGRCMPVLRDKVKNGEDKKIIKLGKRKEYKRGDVVTSIDPIGENLLHEIVDGYNIPATIYGEHQLFPSPTGDSLIDFEIDPFDNTKEYQSGLDTPPWTVLSAYIARKPAAAFIGSIKDNKAYILQNGEVFERNLDNGQNVIVKKSERKTLQDPESRLASYCGSSEYTLPFDREFGDFKNNRPHESLFYGGGGAFIYGYLASGKVDAYVMWQEPYEEIDPGVAIALAAGCEVGYLDERGVWHDYEYNPDREDKTTPGVFVAAATPEIRDEVIDHYIDQHTFHLSSDEIPLAERQELPILPERHSSWYEKSQFAGKK